MRIARIVSSFSLLLFGAVLALAGPYADLNARMRTVPDDKFLSTLAAELESTQVDTALRRELRKAQDAVEKDESRRSGFVSRLRRMLDARVLAESKTTDADAAERIKQIKSMPLYRDSGEVEEASWLSGAADRLSNVKCGCDKRPEVDAPTFRVGAWVTYVAWAILGGALLTVAVVLARHVNWKRGLKRKATALLEEDEPERTVDEWLEMADRLTAEGKYREAVRCLYLACLLKFDEARVARFERSETNWEHLARIEASPNKPPEISFRAPTKAFDLIWYGHVVRGISDVEQFRFWYGQVTEALKRRSAA